MLNFTRFDILKMFKTPALYLILLIFFIGNLVAVAIEYHTAYSRDYEDYKAAYEKQVDRYEAQEKGESQGVYVTVMPPDGELLDQETYEKRQEEGLEDFRLDRASINLMSNLTLAAWVLFAILLGNDFSSGYLKNLLTLEGARRKWVQAKLGLALTYGLLAFVVSLLLGLASAGIAGVLDQGGDWGLILGNFLLNEVYLLVIMGVITSLVLFSQSKVMTLVLSILLAMGLLKSVVSLISSWVKVDMTQFLYSNALAEVNLQSGQGVWLTLGLGLVYMLVFYGISHWRVKRMDFKL